MPIGTLTVQVKVECAFGEGNKGTSPGKGGPYAGEEGPAEVEDLKE